MNASDYNGTNGYDTSNYNLSQNEARVLHSLVKYPGRTDQSIHSQISMKKSTFSSIKTRLKEENYYNRYFIPNFPRIGFELLQVMFGRLNQFTNFEERMRIAGDTIQSFTEDFQVISENNQAYNLSVSENYTEYAKNQQKFLQLYSENKFLSKKGMKTVSFPFEISRIHSFLDYEALLAKLFGFASEPYPTNSVIPTNKVKKVKLTRAERKVLAGLVKYPDDTDTLIAEEVGVSRNTVANAKRKFLKKGYCFPRVIPNIEKLDLNTMVFSYRRFNPRITPEHRAEAVEMTRKNYSPHFFVSKDLDGFMVSSHRDVNDFNEINDEMMRWYNKTEYFVDEPEHYIVDVSNLNIIKELDFLPITIKILGFDPNVPIKDQ
ncbi:MAG: Lrp/AsnC family transcriptional regulator [Candidatus Heimdallarchaeota archaeon]|nr:Lrp/AsnC family transcriptional regulator [Candidatus Heimdallarchaeota archaeon]